MKHADFSFLVPAYNDAKTLLSLVDRIIKTARKIADRFEIRIIDDCSIDESRTILDALARDKRITITYHKKNQGYGRTIKELYVSAGFDWLFTIPGDFQIDPSELMKLLPYMKEYDMIIGWRRNRHDPPVRLFQSKMYNTFLGMLYGLTLHDINSVRLMRRSVIQHVELTSHSAFVDCELAWKAKKSGFKIIEIPIHHKKREGSTGGGGKLSTILPVIADMFRYRLKF